MLGFAGDDGIEVAGQLDLEDVVVEEEKGAEGLTSVNSVQGFWVEAATCLSTARWVMKACTSGAPISLGWRFLWKRMKRVIQST